MCIFACRLLVGAARTRFTVMATTANVFKAHLSPAVLKRHGEPDLRLGLQTVEFPVHKTYIAATCGTLAQLVSSFTEATELCLFKSNTESTADNNTDSISSSDAFGRFLRVLY